MAATNCRWSSSSVALARSFQSIRCKGCEGYMAIGIVPSCGFLSGPSDMQRMTVAMVVHLVLSVLYGLLFGWLAHRLQLAGALLAGAAFGLIVVYAVNFYLIAPLLFPW